MFNYGHLPGYRVPHISLTVLKLYLLTISWLIRLFVLSMPSSQKYSCFILSLLERGEIQLILHIFFWLLFIIFSFQHKLFIFTSLCFRFGGRNRQGPRSSMSSRLLSIFSACWIPFPQFFGRPLISLTFHYYNFLLFCCMGNLGILIIHDSAPAFYISFRIVHV